MDPKYFLKNRNYTFSLNEISDISELVDEHMMNDRCFMDVLEKYDKPRWFVTVEPVYEEIKLVIHANLSKTDSKTIEKEFNDKVAEVVRNLCGKEAMN